MTVEHTHRLTQVKGIFGYDEIWLKCSDSDDAEIEPITAQNLFSVTGSGSEMCFELFEKN